MTLAIASTTSSAIANRIEPISSTAGLKLPRLDSDGKPDVVTLIQTPAEQQKRVETHPPQTVSHPFSYLHAASLDRLRNAYVCWVRTMPGRLRRPDDAARILMQTRT